MNDVKNTQMTEVQAYRLAIAAIINGNGSFAAVRRELEKHGVQLIHPKDSYIRKIGPEEISVKIL